jgi:uncharacterized protein Yka (UPF0111/DUF47 family)
MTLKFLFGRDERFFDLLENSAAQARAGAAHLSKLLQALGHGVTETILADLAQCRRTHKRIANEISEALIKVFMTPLDREDIESLSASLYRISKTMEKVGERLTICPPGAKVDSVAKEVANIEHACEVVQTLVGALRSGANMDNIREPYSLVQGIEGDGDKQLLEHLRELYRSEHDARLLIYWKDLYDLLEKCTDRCRDVGNDVFHIVLKNS